MTQINASREIDLDSIRIDGGTQSRVTIDEEVVSQYAEILDEMPPVIAFFDGVEYWLADGFHRFLASRKANRAKIRVAVRQGTVRAAQLFAAGANGQHGLRRSREDLRKSVSMLLRDGEWSVWSDREIAEHCSVSHTFVGRMREEAKSKTTGNVASGTAPAVAPEVREQVAKIREEGGEPRLMRRTGRDGAEKVTVMNVASHQKLKDESKADPAKPWGEFESQMREQISALQSVAASLRKILGYDSEAKRLTSRWANDYSMDGTVGQINALVRTLESGMPIELSKAEACGYITARRKQVKDRMKVA